MSHHPQLAVAAANALQAAGDVDAALRELLEAVGTIDTAQIYDTGPHGEALVVLPGWQALEDPTQYVILGMMA